MRGNSKPLLSLLDTMSDENPAHGPDEVHSPGNPLAIVVLCTETSRPYGEISKRNVLAYASKWGYTVYYHTRVHTVPMQSDHWAQCTWFKPYMVKGHLSDHEMVFCLDADAIFTNFNLPIEHIAESAPEKSVYMCEDYGGWPLNTGVILYKNQPSAHKLLDEWCAYEVAHRGREDVVCKCHNAMNGGCDQWGLIDVFLKRKTVTPGDDPDAHIANHTAFNAGPTTHEEGMFILHMMGTGQEARRACFTMWNKKLGIEHEEKNARGCKKIDDTKESNHQQNLEVYRPGRKVGIVTLCTTEFSAAGHIGPSTKKNLLAYAALHRYTVYYYTGIENDVVPLLGNGDGHQKYRQCSWIKPHLLRRHMRDHELLLWIDADAIITDFDFGVEDLAAKAPLAQVFACKDIYQPINSGVLLFRNGQFTKKVIGKYCGEEKRRRDNHELTCKCHGMVGGCDQSVLTNILQSEESKDALVSISDGTAFNAHLDVHGPGMFILHAYGSSLKDRIMAFKTWNKKLGLGRMSSAPPEVYNPGQRIAIVSLATPETDDYSSPSRDNIAHYASCRGYTFYRYREMYTMHRMRDDLNTWELACWQKPYIVREHLRHHDAVMWIDADAIVTNMDERIENILSESPRKSVYACMHHNSDEINAGVLLFRRGDTSDAFLNSWLNNEHLRQFPQGKIGKPHCDQGALITMSLEKEWRDHVVVMPHGRFNSFPSVHEDGMFILHMAFQKNTLRKSWFDSWNDRLGVRPYQSKKKKHSHAEDSTPAQRANVQALPQPVQKQRCRKRYENLFCLITIEEGGDVYSSFTRNGISQHTYNLARMLASSTEVKCAFLCFHKDTQKHLRYVGHEYLWPDIPCVGHETFMQELDFPPDATVCFLECGSVLPANFRRTVKMMVYESREDIRCILATFRMGNCFLHHQEKIFINDTMGMSGIAPPVNFDVCITSPHYARNLPYLTSLYRTPAKIVPYIWHPSPLVDATHVRMKRFTAQDFREHDQLPDIYIMEPNASTLKNCLLPLAAFNAWCERDHSNNPRRIGKLYVINGTTSFASQGKIPLHQNAFLNTHIVSHMPFLGSYMNKTVFCERMTFDRAFSSPGILLGYHHNNGLNYLYCEAMYTGVPLIHNSAELGKDVGLYYEDADVAECADRIEQAVAEFSKGTFSAENPEYLRRLETFSIDRKSNAYGYVDALFCEKETELGRVGTGEYFSWCNRRK